MNTFKEKVAEIMQKPHITYHGVIGQECDECIDAINQLYLSEFLDLIGDPEIVPEDFEAKLPDRQEQMDYKSRMWARNDVRKKLKEAAKQRFGGKEDE